MLTKEKLIKLRSDYEEWFWQSLVLPKKMFWYTSDSKLGWF